ncbi:acyl carrier protein [Fulvivirga sediminis]|uniref:Acyl carrier protein n=1 Tax=Fulvivirga sediminis TaxID=2803949 RepID=A0A937F7R0_9BACT|nr:acyl carrier protein [Fulvivirga sediminis]MBL3657876.1 acyl carrier protein [Fulvivirga sediminis]
MSATKANYLDEVKNILTDVGIESTSITEDSNLARDLGLDSLDLTDLMMRLEVKFGIQVNDLDAQQLATVEDVVNYLDKNLG